MTAHRQEQARSLAEERMRARVEADREHGADVRAWRDTSVEVLEDLGLGSYGPARPRAAGPLDASKITIGRAPAAGFATMKPPRSTP